MPTIPLNSMNLTFAIFGHLCLFENDNTVKCRPYCEFGDLMKICCNI